MRPLLIISAVNITEGGALTILDDCISSGIRNLSPKWRIVVLVNNRTLVRESNAIVMSFPSAKKSWLCRLYWEWWGFKQISMRIKPVFWLSLHDITPRVNSSYQAVYCHNPAPFYGMSLKEIILEPRLFIFNKLYFFIYRLFIRRNKFIIVQQQWMREEFIRRLGKLPILVAHPKSETQLEEKGIFEKSENIFLYPALPRVFKNIEVLCEAAKILTLQGITNFEVRLTLSGNENTYAKWLFKKYNTILQIKFLGLIPRDSIVEQYKEATALVFPSKLETWGLPISEAKAYNLPLLVTNQPYSKETVGNYDLISFFPAENPKYLANLMSSIISRTWKPTGNSCSLPQKPFVSDWNKFWQFVTSDR